MLSNTILRYSAMEQNGVVSTRLTLTRLANNKQLVFITSTNFANTYKHEWKPNFALRLELRSTNTCHAWLVLCSVQELTWQLVCKAFAYFCLRFFIEEIQIFTSRSGLVTWLFSDNAISYVRGRTFSSWWLTMMCTKNRCQCIALTAVSN